MSAATAHEVPAVFLSAGEASGDLHGAALAEAIRGIVPGVRLFGIGGSRMAAAGVEIVRPMEEISVVGFAEVVARAPAILAALRDASARFKRERPQLFIPIDFPYFNVRLASAARRAGVPVLYYISPQVWAWRAGRVRALARVVDRMLVIFPFEAPLYERAGVPVEYVGHPLVDRVAPRGDASAFLAAHGLRAGGQRIAVLPGSRRQEVERLLGPMLDTVRWLRDRGRDIDCLVSEAESLPRGSVVRAAARLGVEATVLRGETYDLVGASDFVLVASGTATLEVALLERPMIVLYKVAPLSWQIAKRLVRIETIGLANIAAGRRIVPELLQREVRAEKIGPIVEAYLDDPHLRASVRAELAAVRNRLGAGGASRRAAEAAARMLAGPAAIAGRRARARRAGRGGGRTP